MGWLPVLQRAAHALKPFLEVMNGVMAKYNAMTVGECKRLHKTRPSKDDVANVALFLYDDVSQTLTTPSFSQAPTHPTWKWSKLTSARERSS